jgi:hypothetical protein
VLALFYLEMSCRFHELQAVTLFMMRLPSAFLVPQLSLASPRQSSGLLQALLALAERLAC